MGSDTGNPITITVLVSGYIDCGQKSFGIHSLNLFESSSGGFSHLPLVQILQEVFVVPYTFLRFPFSVPSDSILIN